MMSALEAKLISEKKELELQSELFTTYDNERKKVELQINNAVLEGKKVVEIKCSCKEAGILIWNYLLTHNYTVVPLCMDNTRLEVRWRV